MTSHHTRSGIGYDSHRFEAGGPILLGGVSIPAAVHLVGHSDADAVCHAVTDAILGAAGDEAGNIGELFPNSDAANAGRSSLEMLEIAAQRIRKLGWHVSNVDVTVITEQPRISDHRHAMSLNVAKSLGIQSSQVNVKGKTNEGMGWIGREEGLACIAIATLNQSGQ